MKANKGAAGTDGMEVGDFPALKAKVRRITKRTRGHSPKKVIADLQSYLRGAFNYYGLGIGFGEARCEAGSLSHADAMR